MEYLYWRCRFSPVSSDLKPPLTHNKISKTFITWQLVYMKYLIIWISWDSKMIQVNTAIKGRNGRFAKIGDLMGTLMSSEKPLYLPMYILLITVNLKGKVWNRYTAKNLHVLKVCVKFAYPKKIGPYPKPHICKVHTSWGRICQGLVVCHGTRQKMDKLHQCAMHCCQDQDDFSTWKIDFYSHSIPVTITMVERGWF